MEPPSKGQFGISHLVLWRKVVLFSEVIPMQWESGREHPLLGGCPFLGGSFIGGSTGYNSTIRGISTLFRNGMDATIE